MEIDKIIRSQRKTIAIIIQRDGKLVVRAPRRASDAQIKNFIDLKANWIKAKQAEAAQRLAQRKSKQFINGETFLYLGSAYPLKIVDQAQAPLTLQDGYFLLSRSAQSIAKGLFINWYKKQARQVLSERVGLYAAQFRINYQKIRISSARTRWGSCSSRGTLSFTWRLVMAPVPVIDYVVIHELAHTIEENHSRSFWNTMKSMMCDYTQHSEWLKANGYQLTLE